MNGMRMTDDSVMLLSVIEVIPIEGFKEKHQQISFLEW